MRRLSLLLCVLAAACSVLAASAGAVINGTYDDGAHPYVAMLYSFDTGELCSGSLISAQVIVTAAHCYADGSPVFVRVSPLGFSAGPPGQSFDFLGTFYGDPDFCFDCPGGAIDSHDMGVVILPTAISTNIVSRYAQLPPLGLLDQAQKHEKAGIKKNQKVDFVGFGLRSFNVDADGFFTDFGLRYAGAAKLGDDPGPLGPSLSSLVANGKRSAPAPPGRVKPSPMVPDRGAGRDAKRKHGGRKGGFSGEFVQLDPSRKGQVCSGDSGGPILLDSTDVMIAENSFGDLSCTGPSFGYRLDTPAAQSFIATTVAMHPNG